MTLAEFHAHLATLDWSTKGKRRKAYREAKLLSVLTPDHAALFNAFDQGLSHAPLPEERGDVIAPATGEGLAENTEPARTEPLPAWPLIDPPQVQFNTEDGIPIYTGRIVGVDASPRPMDPFPTLIYAGKATPPRRRFNLWRWLAGAGGWLLWAATVAGVISYNNALPLAEASLALSPQPAGQRLTVIKKYTDQVPQ